MSVATYAQFGVEDVDLYREYLNVLFAEAVRGGDWEVGRRVGFGSSGVVGQVGGRVDTVGNFFRRLEGLNECAVVRGLSTGSVGRSGFGRSSEGLVGKEVKENVDSFGSGSTTDADDFELHSDKHPVVAQTGSLVGGPNLLANRERRRLSKEKKLRRKLVKENAASGVVVESVVPEWRKKFATGDLADTWEKRKVAENRIALLKAEEEIKRLELSASKPLRLPTVKVKTEAEEAEIEFRRREKIRSDTAKYKADTVYWQKRAEKGAVEKAVALEMEILDGQLSGKYDPFVSKRTIGWAKTVKSHGSSSSGGKTVWSGSGASSKTDPSVERIPVEDRSGVLTKYRVENEKLRAEVEKMGKAGARLVRILKKKNAEGFDDGECSFEY